MNTGKLLIGIGAGMACILPLLVQAQDERDADARRARTPATRVETSLRNTRDDMRAARNLLPNVADTETRSRLERLLDHADNSLARAQSDVRILARAGAWEAMPREAFAEALETVKGGGFDDGKLDAVLLLCKHNYFTSRQAAAMMALFAFDDDRVKAAMALYPRTTDPGNFFIVLKTFTYDFEKSKIRDFIAKEEAD